MRSAMILILALLLVSAASGKVESIAAGRYSVSFDLGASESYSIEGSGDESEFTVVIEGEDSTAIVAGYEDECIGIEDVEDDLLDLFEEINVTDYRIYTRTIDGQRGVLGVGSSSDGQPVFVASYPMYFGGQGKGAYIGVVSNFPWEDGTMNLLNTISVGFVPLPEDAAIDIEAAGGEYGHLIEDISDLGDDGIEDEDTYDEDTYDEDTYDEDTYDDGEAEYGDDERGLEDETGYEADGGNDGLVYDGYITFSDNTGASIDDAVIVQNAVGEDDGVDAEYYFLDQKYGEEDEDWELDSQYLVDEGDRVYDRMDIVLSDGTPVTVFFDITDFFGKF